MKLTFSTLLILVLMTGILVACNSTANEITIGEQDNGKTIELNSEDTLVVSLNGNITTGFNWVPAPQDPVLLEQIGDVGVTPDSDKLGSPGTIILQFKAISPGQTTLRLEYKRPWEENTIPEQLFEVTVVVN